MQRATEAAFGVGSGVLLDRFKAWGWFLDDLVLISVNNLTPVERIAKCQRHKAASGSEFAEYQPEAIVSLLLGIKEIVEGAAIEAGSSAARYAVPFPGMGQQTRFRDEMARIIPMLLRLADLHQEAVTGKRPHAEAYAVNRAVNGVKNDTEECIEPAP